MPRNLHYARKECENLIERIREFDIDSADTFDIAVERFWDDQVSLEEMAQEMRDIWHFEKSLR